MRTIQLPARLTIALGRYFLNYQLSNKQLVSTTVEGATGRITKEWKSGRPWDKQADLDNITAALPKGWGYQACAGTFWILAKGVKHHHYYINQKTWPRAEIHSDKAKKS